MEEDFCKKRKLKSKGRKLNVREERKKKNERKRWEEGVGDLSLILL